MTVDRGNLDVDVLLKLVLGLIAVYLVLEILGEILGMIPALFSNIITLGIALLIVLWLLDRI